MEDNDVINVGAIKQVLIFLEPCTDKAFLSVDIEFLVVLHHGFDIDSTEVTHLRTTRIGFAVFLLKHLEPSDGIVGEVVKILDAGFDLLLQILHQFVRFLRVELGDTNHSDLKEFLDIFGAHLADKLRFERRERFVYKLNQFLFVRCVLVSFLLIDTVLNKDLLQRGIEIFLFEFAFLYLEFPFEERFGVVAR